MEKAKIVEQLIDEKWQSKKAFAEHIGLPPTTLRSMLQRGIGKASINNVIKVCKGLGITTEELEEMANRGITEVNSGSKRENLPDLTIKDERDIEKKLQEILSDLDSKSGYAAFDGKSLNEAAEEDRELLIASLKNSLVLAKRLAKQKFTPDKFKK